MGDMSLQDALTISFKHYIEKLLTAEIRSETTLAEAYYDMPLENQREVDMEIRRRAESIGKCIARILVEEGYEDVEPDGRTLSRIVKQALLKYGEME